MRENKLLDWLSRFRSDRRGNFAVITAFLIPIALVAAGTAIDVSSLISTKTKLQAAADSAAVAAGAALVNDNVTIDQAKALALSFVKGQMSSELSAIQADQTSSPNSVFKGFDVGNCTSVDISQTAGSGNNVSYAVTVHTCLDVDLAATSPVLGAQVKEVDVTSTAVSDTASKSALSMYFVLDRSGSMGDNTSTVTGTQSYSYYCGWGQMCTGTKTTYLTKIDSLKQAAGNLLKQISTADPDAYYARLGAVSYNSAMDTPQPLSWGTTAVSNYVNALYASGGTDSSYAFKQAYTSLTSSSEDAAHATKNGQVPDKYIVFMTDGENNYSSATTSTEKTCDEAKAAGIEVFSIGFMAPAAGKAMLQYCATDASHYFDAQSADDMLAAFKYIGEKATKAMTRLTQ